MLSCRSSLGLGLGLSLSLTPTLALASPRSLWLILAESAEMSTALQGVRDQLDGTDKPRAPALHAWPKVAWRPWAGGPAAKSYLVASSPKVTWYPGG